MPGGIGCFQEQKLWRQALAHTKYWDRVPVRQALAHTKYWDRVPVRQMLAHTKYWERVPVRQALAHTKFRDGVPVRQALADTVPNCTCLASKLNTHVLPHVFILC